MSTAPSPPLTAAERQQRVRDRKAVDAAADAADPAHAVASLAGAAAQLLAVVARSRAEADRIEAAVGALTDPEALDRTLAAVRADKDLRVAQAVAAEVTARAAAAEARQRAAAAEQHATDAAAAREEAQGLLDEAADQIATLYGQLTAQATAVSDATANAAERHDDLIEARRQYAADLSDLRQHHQSALDRIRERQQAREAVLEAQLTAAVADAGRVAALNRRTVFRPTSSGRRR